MARRTSSFALPIIPEGKQPIEYEQTSGRTYVVQHLYVSTQLPSCNNELTSSQSWQCSSRSTHIHRRHAGRPPHISGKPTLGTPSISLLLLPISIIAIRRLGICNTHHAQPPELSTSVANSDAATKFTVNISSSRSTSTAIHPVTSSPDKLSLRLNHRVD